MRHEDWFDDNGKFIGSIPRVIWRPIAMNFMPYTHIAECAADIGFCVDREPAIKHLKAVSLWRTEVLNSWSDQELMVEVFISACNSIYDDEKFELLDMNKMENI